MRRLEGSLEIRQAHGGTGLHAPSRRRTPHLRTAHLPLSLPAPAAALNFPRYKIIVQAMVGQQKQQGVRVVSRCLWDPDSDSCSTYTYHSDTLWATVMVFGLYVE